MEVWKDIPEYEGHYQVSNQGRVKSIKFDKERLLKELHFNNGYVGCNLYLNGKAKSVRIHQLIGKAFIDSEYLNKGLVIDHIDRDRKNNNLNNLRVVTVRENTSRKLGTSSRYPGVNSYTNGKWQSRITLKGKRIHLGYFDIEYDAHLAYQQALKG